MSKRNRRVPPAGRTDEADPYEEEIWRDEAAREFEDEPVLIKNYRTKRRFRPKEAAEPIVELKEKFGSEEVPEELSRLGFAINDRTGRWERSAPRTGARTVELLGGDKRTLTIKATTETDFKAISRLEYILTYFRRADISLMNRGAAAAATWIFRGDKSRRRRGCRADEE